MDEREMTSGVIPLRHSSLPGHVRLPRRYEKAAMGTNSIPTRVRRISIQPGQSPLGDSLSERLDDLMAAIMWVKQELILLRQHDILLKRQFFNIQDSIRSLQKPRPTATTTTTTSTTTPSIDESSTVTCNGLHDSKLLPDDTQSDLNGRSDVDAAYENIYDFPLDTYVVRPSSSVTMLNNDSEEEEEEDADIFAEEFFRPRTSSMRTSRDMAALARRRGSKELI